MSAPPIRLKEVAVSDYEVLQRLRADAATRHSLLSHPEAGPAESIESWLERRVREGRIWVIARVANDECLGFAQIAGIHGIDRYASFGIALVPEARGMGAGRSAMQQLFALVRSELALRKLMLHVRVDNLAAIALYESVGFRTIGTLESHYSDGERFHDVVLMEKMLDAPEAAAP